MIKQLSRNRGKKQIRLSEIHLALEADTRFLGSYIRRGNQKYIVYLFIKGVATVQGDSEYLDYFLTVDIPDNYYAILPIVHDDSRLLKHDFDHINPDNTLCIASEIDLRNIMNTDNPINRLFDCIISYLVQYRYWTRYHSFLIRPRGHGFLGTLESYQEIFGVQKKTQLLGLMRMVWQVNKPYKQKCPCDSGTDLIHCYHYHIVKELRAKCSTQVQILFDWSLKGWKRNL